MTIVVIFRLFRSEHRSVVKNSSVNNVIKAFDIQIIKWDLLNCYLIFDGENQTAIFGNQTFKEKAMTDNKAISAGQTNDTENMTDKPDSQTKAKKGQTGRSNPKVVKSNTVAAVNGEAQNDNASQTKTRKNQTDNVKWSIFTEAETKVSTGKAAKKAGLKLNEWIDSRLRQAAIAELTKKAEPPAKTEDLVTDIVQQFADRMKADQAATVQAQNDLIQQQGQQIAALAEAVQKNQPKSIKEMIFGKSKTD